jgi:hypothetical protein
MSSGRRECRRASLARLHRRGVGRGAPSRPSRGAARPTGRDCAGGRDADPFPARPEVFQYLLDHPEFATRVTRVLKVARYRIWREADGLHLDDGWGAIGRFEIVYAAGGTRVMYARGVYQKRLLPDVHGEAVVMIEYGVRPGPDGKSLIAATVTGFVKFDSGFLAAATKLVTPVARAKAEREARTLMKVFAKVSRAAEEEPAALVQDLAREPDVSPRELAEFRKLLNLS